MYGEKEGSSDDVFVDGKSTFVRKNLEVAVLHLTLDRTLCVIKQINYASKAARLRMLITMKASIYNKLEY